MVSIGTILTLGIIGAIGVGGYAVYRNLDKIGGALSTGVEKSITDPLGNWLDNLFKDTPSSGVSGSTNTQEDIIVQAGGKVINTEFVDDPTKFNPPGVTNYGYPTSPYGIPTSPKVTATPTPTGTAFSVELFEGGAAPLPPTPPVIKVNGETFQQSLFKLLTLGGQCIGTTCVKPIPLSQSEIFSFAKQGQIAHEVYL